MNDPHDRLRLARTAAGFRKPADAAARFGWNVNTYKSHENGARGLKAPIAQEYGTAFGVDASWLLYGKGRGPGKGSGEPMAVPSTPPPPAAAQIQEIDVRAGMGGGGEALAHVGDGGQWSADAVSGEWAMPADYLRGELRVQPKSVKLIPVIGDSMSPTLCSDDRVMVNLADKTPSPGGVFALWDGLGVVVKRLQYVPHSDPPTVQIISDNPAHPMFERTLEEINVIGRVVWFARRL